MKKLLISLALALATLSASAQEIETVDQLIEYWYTQECPLNIKSDSQAFIHKTIPQLQQLGITSLAWVLLAECDKSDQNKLGEMVDSIKKNYTIIKDVQTDADNFIVMKIGNASATPEVVIYNKATIQITLLKGHFTEEDMDFIFSKINSLF